MMRLRAVWAKLLNLFRSRRLDNEMKDELRFHLEMETREYIRKGVDPVEARRLARIRFGSIDRFSEECREIRRWSFLEGLWQDLRFALRSFRRNKAFAAITILTLGVGIGANTAMFSVVHGVLLQPLPFPDDDRLVVLRQSAPLAGINDMNFSIPELRDYREQNRSFERLVEYHVMSFILLGGTEPERVNTGVVSADFFDLLGVSARLGRTFLPEEGHPGAEPVLMLSHGYWERNFGADPSVVGRVFEMNDRMHTVVGVLPPMPHFPGENEVYMPVPACPFRRAAGENADSNRNAFRNLVVVGRLKPDVTLETARQDLSAIAQGFMRDYPTNYPPDQGLDVEVVTLKEALTHSASFVLTLLFATAGLLLLLACANVANLYLAYTAQRRGELALRTALGASRGRVLLQLVTESSLLAVLGGVCGLFLAFVSLDLLVAFADQFTARAREIDMNWLVLGFTLAVSVLTGVVFGSIPAFTSGLSVSSVLGQTSRRASSDLLWGRLRSGLILAQVAIAFVLLFGSGLLVKSVYQLSQVDPGFRPDNVVTAEVILNWSKYQDRDSGLVFFQRLLERLKARPDVLDAAVANAFPLSGTGPFYPPFRIEGRDPSQAEAAAELEIRVVSPGYFNTLGIPLREGRFFGPSDTEQSPPVVTISESLSRRYWKSKSPVGERISVNEGESWLRVIGVAGDVREEGLDQASGNTIYLPLFQQGFGGRVLIRSMAEERTVAKLLRECVYAIDPQQPVDTIRTLEEVRIASYRSPRLTATLLTILAVLAFLITLSGITAVVAFSVSSRKHEIGIRMALGARASEVVAMILRQSTGLVALGLLLGVGVSLALSRLWEHLLFEVNPADPWTLAVVTLLLLLGTVLACFWPVHRATSVDPSATLRNE